MAAALVDLPATPWVMDLGRVVVQAEGAVEIGHGASRSRLRGLGSSRLPPAGSRAASPEHVQNHHFDTRDGIKSELSGGTPAPPPLRPPTFATDSATRNEHAKQLLPVPPTIV